MAFSSSLYDLLVNTTDYYSAYNALVITIKEYQSFFSNVNNSLSLQEEQGLCAELIELSALIDKKGEDVVKNNLNALSDAFNIINEIILDDVTKGCKKEKIVFKKLNP